MNSILSVALADLEEQKVADLVQKQLDAGREPMAILEECREGMVLVGKRYEAGEYYVSDLIMAGELFRQAADVLSVRLKAASIPNRGSVVVGTVQGDIHDIGKNIVVTLLRAANFEVHDLGVDVPASRFVEAVKKTDAPTIALSGLLTISFDPMKETVEALQAAGLRPKVKVIVGGGPVNESVREYSGADAWGPDAQAAVKLCEQYAMAQR